MSALLRTKGKAKSVIGIENSTSYLLYLVVNLEGLQECFSCANATAVSALTSRSVRKAKASGASWCILKMITRQNCYPNYRNDYLVQKMLQGKLILDPPEELVGS